MKYLICIMLTLICFSCNKTEKTAPSTSKVLDSLNTLTALDSVKVKPETEQVVKSYKDIKADLEAKGFETFDYIDQDTNDTILMQQYFIAFLKGGTVRTQNEEEAKDLQDQHIAHLNKMYKLGYADISGPFGDNGNLRGITIYNVPTQKMADSLAHADPMVKAGQLEVEVKPWWAAKGFMLR
ncbi:hypothetical protein FNB79_03360 [Formosa sediminum]|uniref:YCII-related domain-containing protein n=1 Tax=Formosa sediminum TaxID=2594004 RepID=A0A516GNW2_9FLAO|nr:YciI family protein [Formosa sediminum]QDO93050.1 hypothetical protein FNB79_03360 [Formosa sediminum]